MKITIDSIGHIAQRVLSNTQQGSVLAVFERSFYLLTERCYLVCIGHAELTQGPLNALCEPNSFPLLTAQPQPSARYYQYGQQLYIEYKEDKIEFNYQRASVWSPPLITPPSSNQLQQRLQKLTILLSSYYLSTGLSPFLLNLASKEQSLKIESNNPFLLEAAAAINILTDALTNSDIDLLTQANNLIGLGPGLTPSGDDFIGGMLLAFRSFDYDKIAQTLADWALPVAKTQTNQISYAHLCCAAEGAGAAPLHDFLNALGNNQDLTPSLNAIGCIGHSSGWDALAGIICACAILCRL